MDFYVLGSVVLPIVVLIVISIVAVVAARRWDCLFTRSLLLATIAPAITLIGGYGWVIASIQHTPPQQKGWAILTVPFFAVTIALVAFGTLVGTWCLAVIVLYTWRRLRGKRPATRGGRRFDLALLVVAVATLSTGGVLAFDHYEGHTASRVGITHDASRLQAEFGNDRWRRHGSRVARALAANNQCPPPILAELSSHHGDEVRTAVARNANTGVDALRGLSADPVVEVRAAVAGNRNCSVDILRQWARSEDLPVSKSLARNTATPTDVLRVLADHPDSAVAAELFINRNTPAELIRKVAGRVEMDTYRRCLLCRNPATPPDVLRTAFGGLREHDGCYIMTLWGLAENLNTPLDVLEQLAVLDADTVLSHILPRREVRLELLELLTQHQDARVRAEADRKLDAISRGKKGYRISSPPLTSTVAPVM